MARILLLDLDGTMVDTVPDLAGALNRLMVSRGLAPFSLPETALMIGDGVTVLVGRAFAARGLTPDDQAMADFSRDYGAHVADASRPFPGIPGFMRDVAADGWRLAVCTNKTEAAARALLETLGLMDLVCAIGGGDSFPVHKPDPAHLLATLKLAEPPVRQSVPVGSREDPGGAVMVGDHSNDVAAARGAGVKVVFVTWGYGPIAMGAGADAVVDDIPALREAIEQLVPEPGQSRVIAAAGGFR